ncbi:MAG: SMP-30/gluconolactonase/LRE family protein [Verrucomicrobia subdivision 3 bacterium]|nr:SMP-30/gluconolactonase/LRE family protein [Limisphaerales bacterium]
MKFHRKLSRRKFLQTSSATAAFAIHTPARAAGISGQYAGLKSGKFLGEVKTLATVEDRKVFLEGPAVGADGDVFFTNVPMEKILRWSVKGKKLATFREKSNKANGLLFDPKGRLLACEGGAGRVTRTDLATGKISVLANKFNDFPLAAPNDLELTASGKLFFTSRPGTPDPKKGNPNAVYRLDLATGKLHQPLAWPKVHMPNGIVIAPDGKTLYLIEAHPDANRNRSILAFDLDQSGQLSNRRTHINFYPGRSGDGMCIDAEGNLYVAAGLHKTRRTSETLDTRPGIHVISPQGKLIAFRQTPTDTLTNCTFGGSDLRTLYITSGAHLHSIRTAIPGKASYKIG